MRVAGRLLVAVVVFLVAGEVLARALHVVDRLNGFSRSLYARGPDAELPYRLRPGIDTTLLGIPVHVNRFGLRGPEISAAPAPGVTRVLVLGDSVVFGHGLAAEDAMPAVLQQRLDGGFEVLNAGVSGYDTVAEVRFLEVYGLALAPAVVVVGVSLNDYDPAPVLTSTGLLVRRADRAGRWTDRSEFLTLLRWIGTWWRGGLFAQMTARAPGTPGGRLEALERFVEESQARFYHAAAGGDWERLRGAWARLGRLATAHRLRVVMAIFPEQHQVGVADPDLEPQRRLVALCAATGLRCLDLQPAFAAAGGELFQDLYHPNARGHAVAAAAVARALRE